MKKYTTLGFEISLDESKKLERAAKKTFQSKRMFAKQAVIERINKVLEEEEE